MVNRDKSLIWNSGEFDTSMLSNEYYYFELIEDNTIDIQSIEEFSSEYTMNSVEFQLQDKINELVRGLKQLDKQIKESQEG